MTTPPHGRWAWAEVDLGAIAANVGVITAMIDPTPVWAVVKADGYGHGAVPVARAALDAGAAGLCVALVQEGVELRAAGITAPILVLSPQPTDQVAGLVRAELTATVAGGEDVAAVARAARAQGVSQVAVHLKIDTGMHRAGASPADALDIAAAIDSTNGVLTLEGVFTHLAMADEPHAPANSMQLQRFASAVDSLRQAGHSPRVIHAVNSAGAMTRPTARHDLARVGIALYGIEPGPDLREVSAALRPALSLHARVARVHVAASGEGISYGHRRVLSEQTTIATVPIGYADGVPRRLASTGGVALVHGARVPIAGVVTMDQLMLDCSPLTALGIDVAVGDAVVLLGRQTGAAGTSEVRAEDWAERLDTIGYEIVCGISRRIERRYRG